MSTKFEFEVFLFQCNFLNYSLQYWSIFAAKGLLGRLSPLSWRWVNESTTIYIVQYRTEKTYRCSIYKCTTARQLSKISILISISFLDIFENTLTVFIWLVNNLTARGWVFFGQLLKCSRLQFKRPEFRILLWASLFFVLATFLCVKLFITEWPDE